MKNFSKVLQRTLLNLGWTSQTLAELSTQGTDTLSEHCINRFLGEEDNRPEPQFVEQICSLLPLNFRGIMAAAYLHDVTPPCAAHLIAMTVIVNPNATQAHEVLHAVNLPGFASFQAQQTTDPLLVQPSNP